MLIIKDNISKRINYITLHVISDLNLPLCNEINETFKIEINSLLKTLDNLIETTNVIISNIDDKVLIANNDTRMIALTLKENDISWLDIMSYRLTSYIYRNWKVYIMDIHLREKALNLIPELEETFKLDMSIESFIKNDIPNYFNVSSKNNSDGMTDIIYNFEIDEGSGQIIVESFGTRFESVRWNNVVQSHLDNSIPHDEA